VAVGCSVTLQQAPRTSGGGGTCRAWNPHRSPHGQQRAQRRLQRQVGAAHTGVIFFDKLHGQIGGAWNGVEPHPVLKVEAPRRQVYDGTPLSRTQVCRILHIDLKSTIEPLIRAKKLKTVPWTTRLKTGTPNAGRRF
jgi:hypothetical protein